MKDFTLDFDLKGDNYVVVVQPHESRGIEHYKAVLDEDHSIDYLLQGNGDLQPNADYAADPQLVNAIATRILQVVHVEDRGNGATSYP
ncbi:MULTISPECIES: hypothetical protein [Chitinophaga]|uniref:Uncharacterized protein n=2 Tax=Chitinophaga TaxID=79328 RepID=A0A1G7XYK6_CHIFI|nr:MULTISPECIES: hypothetical protein [Chitinophaga]PSL28876.1 hypothetical protein CLV42_10722 [Chitinophaga ginsengisoli]SDG89221.1 hypothetical protein SAMN04488121_107135 [Chitinophaga filiformis]